MLCVMVTSPLTFDPCARSCMDASTLAALACNRAFAAVDQVHQLGVAAARPGDKTRARPWIARLLVLMWTCSCVSTACSHSSSSEEGKERRAGVVLCSHVHGHLCRRHSPTRHVYSRPPSCPSSWLNTSFKQTISTRFLPCYPVRYHRWKRKAPSAAVCSDPELSKVGLPPGQVHSMFLPSDQIVSGISERTSPYSCHDCSLHISSTFLFLPLRSVRPTKVSKDISTFDSSLVTDTGLKMVDQARLNYSPHYKSAVTNCNFQTRHCCCQSGCLSYDFNLALQEWEEEEQKRLAQERNKKLCLPSRELYSVMNHTVQEQWRP